MMPLVHLQNLFIVLYILGSAISCFSFGHGVDGKVLTVGKELWRETLPLQSGACLYELHGLKAYSSYEVKISYPASIPASFTIQLKRGNLDSGLTLNRRLLNTEKLIFNTDSLDALRDQAGMYVLVSVEPEGIVAIPDVQEREFIIFNIVCDELLLGIPRNAWWVAVLVLFCLGLAFAVPFLLPSCLLKRNQSLRSLDQNVSKEAQD